MVLIKDTSINWATKRLSDGSVRYYYYAWKGGPKFWTCDGGPISEPAPRAFKAAYEQAKAEADRDIYGDPEERNLVSGLIVRYRTDDEFKRLSPKTRKEYATYLDVIRERWGKAPVRLFTNKRTRPKVKKWHQSYSDKPRMGDLYLMMLVKLMNFAVDEAMISNHCIAKINRLYRGGGRAKIIWEPQEFAALVKDCEEHEVLTFTFALLTGLRGGDLVNIPISANKGDWLQWTTSKSNQRNLVLIPIYDELRECLVAWEAYKKHKGFTCTTICCNSRGRPWGKSGVDTAFDRARSKTGIKKRFHDFRGTTVTKLCGAGFSNDEIADWVGWSTEDVKQVRKHYVDIENIMSAQIKRLNRNT